MRDNISKGLLDTSSAMSRILSEAPFLPRCSDNKTATLVRPREYALNHPYMQINRKDMVSWLIFDLDHSSPLIWESENLPAPNFIVSNRKNGHSHIYYAITPVCTSENALSKPIKYMKAVYEAMATKLNADLSYSGPVAKTPNHPWWSTWEIHSEEYELGELADSVDLISKPFWSKNQNLEDMSHSRHCLLFEDLRFYAYSIVNDQRKNGTYLVFKKMLEAYAFNKNNFRKHGFSTNLTFSQLSATVKSVSRWTWDKYTGDGSCHRGVMTLNKGIPLAARQALSARRTHTERKRKTASKIRAACNVIKNKGKSLTLVAVAKSAGLTRQTVSNYAQILKEVATTPHKKVANLHNKTDVKYGVHQITAALFPHVRSSFKVYEHFFKLQLILKPPDT